jgi:hypothetical protein
VQSGRIWSHQGDSIAQPEVAGLANYDATRKWWKPAAAPVAVKMFNIAPAIFGNGMPAASPPAARCYGVVVLASQRLACRAVSS